MRVATWMERTELQLRSLTPFVFTLLMVLVSAIPWHIPNFVPITPLFSVMAIYYWSIYRPDKLPYVATFALGLLHDLLTGTPLGLSALVYLLLQSILSSQRTFFHGKPFLVVWWGFSLVMPVFVLVSWVIASLYYNTFLPPLPFVIQAVLTMLLYPLFALLLIMMHRHMMRGT
ncbi:MAG: rod shape-determining protein MreD [Rhodospirillaceae bacterium]|nr:rod shape-determining protein MreD [Rhodospirillaceae bacterium]